MKADGSRDHVAGAVFTRSPVTKAEQRIMLQKLEGLGWPMSRSNLKGEHGPTSAWDIFAAERLGISNSDKDSVMIHCTIKGEVSYYTVYYCTRFKSRPPPVHHWGSTT